VAFLVGALAIFLVLGVVGGGAHAIRSAILPGWDGAIARLAELVLGLTLVLGTAQVLGVFSAFRPGAVFVAEVAVGAIAWAIAGRLGRPASDEAPSPDHQPGPGEDELGVESDVGVGIDDGTSAEARTRSYLAEQAVALIGVGVVAVQWMAHTGDAVRRGMTHPDTLWYHLPFAARFVQHGDFDDLGGIGYRAARYFPLNSQLVHALGILGVGSDALSPYLNLAWAALALLAAWCVGARHGHGPLAVLAAAVALGIPAMAATQPGQASSDIACAALLLTAVALLFEASDLEPAPIALAGLATGLSLSTKVTIALPIAVLVLGTFILILLARRFRVAALWAASVAVTGSFWFLRNWVQTRSPLPWFDIEIGPVVMPAAIYDEARPLADTIFDGTSWGDLYLPGLWQGLGRAWPLVVGLAVVGAVLAMVRGRRFERLVGVAVIGGLVGHVFTPLTGGFSFVFNLRYLTPMLLLGFVLLARFCPGGRTGRLALSAILAVVLVADALTPHRERVEAWPTEPLPWVLAIVAVAVALAAAYRWSRARTQPWTPAVVVGVTLALLVTGAWAGQQYYLDHRYVDLRLHADEVDEYFREVSDARVAVLGTDETYPMFGLDSSNRITSIIASSFPELTPCRDWRHTFGGRFDYIVLTSFGFNVYPQPDPWILADDPAVTEVAREGDSIVYRLDGPLDPESCPP
jgi:hypothetical protein